MIEAVTYYAGRGGPNLGEALLRAFEKTCEIARLNPEIGVVWRSKTRMLSLDRFPYNLIYVFQQGNLRVIALAHQRRRPGYWRGRTPEPR